MTSGGLLSSTFKVRYCVPGSVLSVLTLLDFARKTCGAIAEQYVNEQAYDGGYIFLKIRLYHLRGHEDEENRWWARLSKTKQKDLQQLLKNPHYRSVFDSLLPWPGLWQSVKLGSLHRLLTMKCDEVRCVDSFGLEILAKRETTRVFALKDPI